MHRGLRSGKSLLQTYAGVVDEVLGDPHVSERGPAGVILRWESKN